MATRTYMTNLITGISDGGKTQAGEMRTLLTVLMNESFKLYEVKELDVNLTSNPSFLTDNFNSSGLGISDSYQGFAICNGNNNTRNRNGRVAIGYDPNNYPTIGAANSAATTQVLSAAHLPAHSHTYTYWSYDQEVGSSGSDAYGIHNYTTQGTTGVAGSTSPTGFSIMQPYIVTLFIQRIS